MGVHREICFLLFSARAARRSAETGFCFPARRARVQGFVYFRNEALVRRWKADGHLSAMMKDRDAERARQVLERTCKAAEHKPSFLGLATPLD